MAEVGEVRESDVITAKGLDVGETLPLKEPLDNSFGTFESVTDFPEGCTPADILNKGDVVMFRTINSFIPRVEPYSGSTVEPNRPLSESVTEVVLGKTPDDLDVDEELSGKKGEYLLYERTIRESPKSTQPEIEEKYTFLDPSELDGAVIKVNNKLTMFAPNRERGRQITLKGRVQSVKALHRAAPPQS